MSARTGNKTLGLITIFLATLVTTVGREQTKRPVLEDSSYIGEIEKWRAVRLKEINGEDGWNTLVGLFWLKEGQNRFGSDPSNDIVLPKDRSPKLAGSLWLNKGIVRLEAKTESGITHNRAPVSDLVLQTDADGGKPTALGLGSLTLFVIKRGEKIGLRVKDKQHPARLHFSGLDYFPIDTRLRVEAKFEAYNPTKIIPIVKVLGMIDNMNSPGALVFVLNGKTYRLDPVLEKGSKELFIIFADKTAGKETYGAGRYLYAEPPAADGKVVLDFNKAHNPPCAFTKFATCPLPPRQNRLAIRIEAGEKKYVGSAH